MIRSIMVVSASLTQTTSSGEGRGPGPQGRGLWLRRGGACGSGGEGPRTSGKERVVTASSVSSRTSPAFQAGLSRGDTFF